MKFWALALTFVLAACASTPASLPKQQIDALFNDALFATPSERISASDVFAVSDEMRAYVKTGIARLIKSEGSQRALFDALYDKGLLKLEYDAETTRNASEAFSMRSGNCLSLVIMCYLWRYQAEGQPERPERTVTARLTVATLPKSREANETKMTLR